MDLLPTFCEITGTGISQEIDGQSLASLWLQGRKPDPNRTMIWVRREGGNTHQGRAYYAARKGNWKLLQNHPFEPMKLIDMQSDHLEQNPGPPNGKIARQLSDTLSRHIQRSGSVPWQ